MNIRPALLLSFLLSLLVYGIMAEESTTMTAVELESRSCSKLNGLGRSRCSDATNCCYYEYYDKKFDTLMPVCTSINAFTKYYVKDVNKYLIKTETVNYYSHVQANNFCEIISNDPDIQQVNYCSCRSMPMYAMIAMSMCLFNLIAN